MPKQMEKIVFLDQGTLPVPLRKPAFLHEWVDFERTAQDEVVQRLEGVTIAITNKVKLREPVLSQLPDLRFIAVANIPGYTGESVPEHVFMLMLALRRNLLSYARLIEKGAWQKAPHFVIQDYPIENVSGCVLGLIGYGRLAQAVEKRALAFGMKVLISDRKGAIPVRPGRVAFEEVLRQSDVISLHAPMTPETRGLLGGPELAQMKPSALLINTARGGLVDEAALAAALIAGQLGGAGIDVLSEEPPRQGSPLLDPTLPNLIVTPHIAWSSRQSLAVLAEELIQNIEAFAGGQARNRVA